jgi:hypothetical protein
MLCHRAGVRTPRWNRLLVPAREFILKRHAFAARPAWLLALLAAFLTAGSPPGGLVAQTPAGPEPSGAWVRLENDIFLGTDGGFTGAMAVGWDSRSLRASDVWTRIPWMAGSEPDAVLTDASYLVGQNIYTPRDIRAREVVADDRPYAGLLHATVALTARLGSSQRTTSGTLGLVGPWSLARQVHAGLHRLIGSPTPNGWDHQLSNEPVVQLNYEQRWRLPTPGAARGFGVALVPHYTLGVGNLAAFASVGGEVRVGWRLADYFGLPISVPGGLSGASGRTRPQDGVSLFGRIDQKAVLRNIFLDGNTLVESHRVDSDPLPWDVLGGVEARAGRFSLRSTLVFWSRRYATEVDGQAYSTLELRWIH